MRRLIWIFSGRFLSIVGFSVHRLFVICTLVPYRLSSCNVIDVARRYKLRFRCATSSIFIVYYILKKPKCIKWKYYFVLVLYQSTIYQPETRPANHFLDTLNIKLSNNPNNLHETRVLITVCLPHWYWNIWALCPLCQRICSKLYWYHRRIIANSSHIALLAD